MKKQQLSNALHVGGTVETALNGKYTLKASSVLQEAFRLTHKHFWGFLPAILLLICINMTLIYVMLVFFSDSPRDVLTAYVGKREMDPNLLYSGQMAMSTASMLCAPFYAGASLMGLSHAIGFRTKLRHLLKGFAFTVSVIFVVGLTALLQSIGNQLLPLVGMFIGVMLSMTVLLICEKRLNPLSSIVISFRAISKKMITLLVVYTVIAIFFILAYATAGVALVWALPFMFNVKGVLYREMFGVGIEVTVSQEDDDDPSSDKDNDNKEVFNA